MIRSSYAVRNLLLLWGVHEMNEKTYDKEWERDKRRNTREREGRKRKERDFDDDREGRHRRRFVEEDDD